jgi:hypothetical protein
MRIFAAEKNFSDLDHEAQDYASKKMAASQETSYQGWVELGPGSEKLFT